MNTWKEQLLRFYVERGAFAIGGPFKLGSGGTSDVYIDGRMVATHPPALKVITRGMLTKITQNNLLGDGDILVAPVVSGIAIGVALSLETDEDLILDRHTTKDHGMGKRFEGIDINKKPLPKRALIVDDLMTKGQTVLRTVIGVRELGISVTDVIVVVDREDGGEETLKENGIRLHKLLTMQEMFEFVGYVPKTKASVV